MGSGQTAASDAPSLEQLVRAAMARDTALAQRQLEVRSRQLGVARRGAAKGFGLGLSVAAPEGPPGLLGFTLADIGGANEFDVGYGLNTSLAANLPHPFGSVSTTVSLSGPVEESAPSPGYWRCAELPNDGSRQCTKVPERPAEESPWDLSPVVSLGLSTRIEQPLGSLLGLDATPADDLEAAHAVVQAERGVRVRVRAITRDILERMIRILQRRIAERRSMHQVAELEDEVVRRRDVFQDNEQSHRFQTLLFNLETGAPRPGDHPAPAAAGARRLRGTHRRHRVRPPRPGEPAAATGGAGRPRPRGGGRHGGPARQRAPHPRG